MNFSQQRGFTLIEILVVITILVTLSAVSVTVFSKFSTSRALTGSVQTVLSILDDARTLTLASKDGYQYGVHFETTKVVLFKGTVYSSSDSDNDITVLQTTVEISNITLTGSGSDVVFSRLTGKTAQNGTVRLSLVSDSTSSSTINIQTTGIAEVN
ncbi:type II secretion system protein [Patescibacteria group bacterium]|nr:type II secretion system protein [Patescibacteria group bacterium]